MLEGGANFGASGSLRGFSGNGGAVLLDPIFLVRGHQDSWSFGGTVDCLYSVASSGRKAPNELVARFSEMLRETTQETALLNFRRIAARCQPNAKMALVRSNSAIVPQHYASESMNLLRSAACFLLLVAVSAAAQASKDSGQYLKEAAISESKDVVHIVANSPRPLEQVLEALRKKYGWVVDYEDPQYTASQDIVQGSGDTPMKYPSGGTFSVEFPAKAPDEEKTLHLIIDAYNKSKNPGQFELRRGPENQFYVVGNAAHDEKGGISSQTAALDVPVTLPSEERALTETLDLLCQEISKQIHVEVVIGVSPRALLGKSSPKIGGAKIPARELLMQSLAATKHTLYWSLFYDPNTKGYLLSIHSAKVS